VGHPVYTLTLSLTSTLDGDEWSKPRPCRFTPGKRDPVAIVKEDVWAPGPFWKGEEYLAATGIRSTDCPARSGSRWSVTRTFDGKKRKVTWPVSIPWRQTRGTEAQRHLFLTSAMGEGELWTSCPGRLTPGGGGLRCTLNRKLCECEMSHEIRPLYYIIYKYAILVQGLRVSQRCAWRWSSADRAPCRVKGYRRSAEPACLPLSSLSKSWTVLPVNMATTSSETSVIIHQSTGHHARKHSSLQQIFSSLLPAAKLLKENDVLAPKTTRVADGSKILRIWG